MGVTEVAQMAGQFGPMGLLVGYFIWRESNDRRDRRDETESRLKLTIALSALTAAITGRP